MKLLIVEDNNNFRDVKYVRPEFVVLMEEILAYGHSKHRAESFQTAVEQGNHIRVGDRLQSNRILHHIHQHALDYEQEVLHDHFHDLEHQLAAVSVNAMMECYFLLGESRDNMDVQGESRSPDSEIPDC